MKTQDKYLLPPPAVKLGTSGQVVIPKKIHSKLRLSPGDYLSVELLGGKVVFTPKALIDKDIEEGLEDIKKGSIYGPFVSAKAMARSLRATQKPKRAA